MTTRKRKSGAGSASPPTAGSAVPSRDQAVAEYWIRYKDAVRRGMATQAKIGDGLPEADRYAYAGPPLYCQR